MATTTPNFGWVVPTSTDLVKDGATAIETLGDSIDASLVDLKGGTTGQVLKKNSGTDMDFVWGTDTAGMTNPMTTTGDIIYSSSGSTPARLGIGTTGQVLNVTGGVPAWATPAAAGGFTLLSTTTLAASEVNITGISQSYKMLMIEMINCQFTSGNSPIQIRLDGENGGHSGGVFYLNSFQTFNNSPAYVGPNTGDNKPNISNNVTMFVYNYTDAANPKPFQFVGNCNFTTGQERRGLIGFGVFTPARVIDSLTIFNDNSMTGTVKIYGGN
jgi:hypothetical protein